MPMGSAPLQNSARVCERPGQPVDGQASKPGGRRGSGEAVFWGCPGSRSTPVCSCLSVQQPGHGETGPVADYCLGL